MSEPGSAGYRLATAFQYNKGLQSEVQEIRGKVSVDPLRYDIRLVGSALIRQQERAIQSNEAHAKELRKAAESQTAATREQILQDAANTERLNQAIQASAASTREALASTERAVQQTTQSIDRMSDLLSAQITELRWEIAQQGKDIAAILRVLQESLSNEARQLNEQGEKLMRSGYVDEAVERFDLALKQDPTSYTVHQNLGILAVAQGDGDRALRHFRKAADFAPNGNPKLRAVALAHMARVHYAREEWPQMRELLERAAQDDPSAAKVHYDMLVADARRGIVDGATLLALDAAVSQDSRYLGLALSDPELEPIRPSLASRALQILDIARDAAESRMSDLEKILSVAELFWRHDEAGWLQGRRETTQQHARRAQRAPAEILSDERTRMDVARDRGDVDAYSSAAAHLQSLTKSFLAFLTEFVRETVVLRWVHHLRLDFFAPEWVPVQYRPRMTHLWTERSARGAVAQTGAWCPSSYDQTRNELHRALGNANFLTRGTHKRALMEYDARREAEYKALTAEYQALLDEIRAMGAVAQEIHAVMAGGQIPSVTAEQRAVLLRTPGRQ